MPPNGGKIALPLRSKPSQVSNTHESFDSVNVNERAQSGSLIVEPKAFCFGGFQLLAARLVVDLDVDAIPSVTLRGSLV